VNHFVANIQSCAFVELIDRSEASKCIAQIPVIATGYAADGSHLHRGCTHMTIFHFPANGFRTRSDTIYIFLFARPPAPSTSPPPLVWRILGQTVSLPPCVHWRSNASALVLRRDPSSQPVPSCLPNPHAFWRRTDEILVVSYVQFEGGHQSTGNQRHGCRSNR
jgi:hypothetical protein